MKEKIVIRKHPRIVEGIRTFGNRSMVDQRVLVPRVIGSSPISRSKTYGGYGVMAAQLTVTQFVRVRISIFTPILGYL